MLDGAEGAKPVGQDSTGPRPGGGWVRQILPAAGTTVTIRWRRGALVAWAVSLVGFCWVRGLPLDRATQTLWILSLLFAASIGRPWAARSRILLDWLPFVGFLYLYDYTRGLASWVGMPVHVDEAAALDKVIGAGQVPTVRLQHALFDPTHVRWYDIVVSLTYFTHFFLVWIIAAVLYLRSRAQWAAWARRLLVLSYAGLVTFIVYPAAPPWYAAQRGVIAPVSRIASRGWDTLGLHITGALIQQGQAASNDVAAIPSLHGGFPLLVTVFFWRRSPVWLRTLMVAYTAMMAFSLVYAGEHYVVDILIGYVYVAATMLAVTWWERRRGHAIAGQAGRTDEQSHSSCPSADQLADTGPV